MATTVLDREKNVRDQNMTTRKKDQNKSFRNRVSAFNKKAMATTVFDRDRMHAMRILRAA